MNRTLTAPELELVELAKQVNPDFGAPFTEEFLHKNVGFCRWSGSAKAEHHHYGHGGLILHTLEVVRIGMAVWGTMPHIHKDVPLWRFFVAAIYHDVGKLDDYEWSVTYGWQGTPHKRLIHHVSGSALRFCEQQQALKEATPEAYQEVLHAILAHHGQREWGSPVAPATRLAWLLHLSDNMSARLDDCVRFDPYASAKG